MFSLAVWHTVEEWSGVLSTYSFSFPKVLIFVGLILLVVFAIEEERRGR